MARGSVGGLEEAVADGTETPHSADRAEGGGRDEAAAPAAEQRSSFRRRIISWPRVLAFVCLVIYVAVGAWLLFDLHYVIGDSMVRSTNARLMLFGRDPHLAALGFVWMPLPVVCTLPLTLLLEPFGLALFAGAAGTSMAGSLTILVLARTCTDLGLRPFVSAAICIAYGLNPVIVFFSANGMSEAWFLLFSAISVRAFLLWWREPVIRHLGSLAIGLGLCVLTRYEALAVLVVVSAAAALRMRRQRWVMTFVTAIFPGAFAFAVWLIVNKIIQGDWFFWLHALQGTADPGEGGRFIPAERTLISGARFAVARSLAMSPQIFLLTPLALWVLLRRRRIEGVAILLGAFSLPAAIAVEIAKSSTYGNARYFVPLSLFAAMLGMWLLARLKRLRAPAGAGLVVLLVAGAASATLYESGANHANVESEYVVFSRVLGRTAEGREDERYRPQVLTWRKLARDLDAELKRSQLVLADVSVSFPAIAYTRHPDRWVISSDRDFEPILADPVGRVDWLVVSSVRSGELGSQLQRALTPVQEGRWELWRDYGIAKVYNFRSKGSA